MIKNKILVIDDEPSIVQSICRTITLDDEEYELCSANNGRDGLKLYYEQDPVLIILDLNMPVMGGIEFLENIKLASFDPCSVVVLTGQGDDKNIEKCFELGISAFLRKPFNNCEIIGVVRHCIALKRIQQMLKEQIARRELIQKDINDQREKFIAVLMHDLKNPLIPVANLAGKLVDGNVKSDEDKIQKLKIIQESSERLLTIIDRTSTALRNRTMFQAPKPEFIALKDIILFVIKNFLSTVEDKGIEILINDKDIKKWDEVDDFTIEADYYQMNTLVENLIDNAIKYTKSKVLIEITRSDGLIRLAISDNGPGIEEIYHERIFEDYFQMPGSKKGYGLGLSSVKSVVKNHKGKISVKSSSVNGTTFEVALPCK